MVKSLQHRWGRGFWLALLVFVSLAAPLRASHFMGFDAWTQCLGNDTVRLFIRVYGDCESTLDVNGLPCLPGSGGCGVTSLRTTWQTPPGCAAPINPLFIGNWQLINYSDVTPTCGSVITRCEDRTSTDIAGVREATFYVDIDMRNTNCSEYILSFENCCRNSAISNIQGPGSRSIYAEVRITRPNNICNSSPEFTIRPVPYFCNNRVSTISMGAFDPDGDSLSFRFGPCGGSATGQPVTYISGATVNEPLPTNNRFAPTSINPVTGDVTISPSAIGQYIMCVFVDEWRNGVLIGTSVRDIQFVVRNCTGNPPTFLDFSNAPVINPATANLAIDLCQDDSAMFVLWPADTTGSDLLFFSSNINSLPLLVNNGAEFIASAPSPRANAIFRWPNPIAGTYQLAVTITGDFCPLRLSNTYTITIDVTPNTLTATSAYVVNCNEVNFNPAPFGGKPPYRFLWEGEDGLLSTLPSPQHLYSGPGTYDYTLTVVDNGGCTVVDSGQVIINTQGGDVAYDISTRGGCTRDTVVFTYTGADPSEPMLWSFGSFAVPPTAAGPGPHAVTWNAPGRKLITYQIEKDGCTTIVNDSVQVNDRPVVSAGDDLRICANGDSIVLQGQAVLPPGFTNCGFLWSPSTGLNDPTLLNPKAKPGTTTTYTLQTVCGTCISSFDSMTLTVTPAPVVNIGPDRVNTCFGTSGVSLPTTVTGGSGNLLYFWSPAAGLSNPRIPNPIASPNQTTMYSLVVIDTEGCQSDSDFVQVFVDSIPYADAGPDFFICENGPGVQLQPQGLLGGFGSYNFVWTPAAGLNDPTSPAPIARPDTTTIYQLEVINRQTGCSSRATGLDTLSTVLVSVTPRPIAEGGLNQTICVNDSVQLGGLPSNGGFTYTYAWSPSAGLSDSTAARPMASPRFTTQYFVTVSSLGCPSVIDSVTVTVKPVPTASTQPTEEVCRGDSVQLISYAAAGAAIGYRWEPATGLSDPRAARPLASPAQDTRYDLFVSFDGCETFSGASVFVSVLDAPQLDADTVHAQNGFDTQDGFRLCQGDSLVLPARLGANRVDYFYWEANPTLSRTDVVNPTARPTESVVYYVVAAIGGCESRDSILVQVLPEINPQIEGPTEVICARQEVLLTASGGIGSARYRWWPADGLNRTDGSVVLASPAQTTTYYVEVSEGGCADTASFTLSVLPQPVLDFDYSYDAGCTGLSVSFANLSTDGAAYIWDFGDGSPVVNAPEPTHTYPQPGQYLVSLRVPAGSSCYDEIRMERIIDVRDPLQAAFDAQPPAPITLTIPEAIVTVQAQTPNAVSWFWQFGDGQTATTPIATHQYRYAGEYIVSLQVTDAIGCKADVQSARYTVRAPELDIPSVFTPNGDGFNDRWIVGYTGVERYRAWVMDRWGQVVFDANSATQHWDGNDAKGNPVPTGVYFYVVETGERTFKGNVSILR